VSAPISLLRAVSTRFRIGCAALALGAGLLPVRADDHRSDLYGRLEGEVYVAPADRYRVSIPVLPELGGQVHDTENVVTFDDNLSTHASIACFPLDVDQKTELEVRGLRRYLGYFYTEFVLADFRQRFPAATDEKMLFVPEYRDGALLGFALLPGGSVFAARDALPGKDASDPSVAKRGNLLFLHDNAVFVVSIELAERVTERSVFHKTPAEEDVILRERLLQLANRIQFPTAPKPPAPAGAGP
jgi:hypothetical protein